MRLKSAIEKCDSERDEYKREVMRILLGHASAPASKLVSSNLRRAINTGCIALWPRLKRTNEKITILSSLQEMSRNVDTESVAGKGELPEMSLMTRKLGNQFVPERYLDAKQSDGNKALNSRAVQRMDAFCKWCFKQPEPVIIVAA